MLTILTGFVRQNKTNLLLDPKQEFYMLMLSQGLWFFKDFLKRLKKVKFQDLSLFQEIIMMFLELTVHTDKQHQWEMEVWFVLIWRFKILLEQQQEEQLGLPFIMEEVLDGDKSLMEDMELFWPEPREKENTWEISCCGMYQMEWVEDVGQEEKMHLFMLNTWWKSFQA